MTAPELKPCPFCGGEADIWRAHEGRTAWIACMGKCVVLVSKEYLSDDEAIAAWNRRADLAAVQPAQVRVTPLVFNHINLGCFVYSAHSNVGYYEIHQDAGLFSVWYNGRRIYHALPILEAAKAAAMADYEARILAALEPQPDPRDEVIKGLVEAVQDMRRAFIPFSDDEFRAVYAVDATLAAAKAV